VDTGENMENHGCQPDIPVEISPQDFAAGRDPQLQEAVVAALKIIEQNHKK
jgi:tricorn protease